jgi:hypothetical protein
MQFTPNIFQCPLCGMTDTVTKVSSIVEAGTTSHSAHHTTVYTRGFSVRGIGTGSSSGTSATHLATKLSPPSLPQFFPPGASCLIIGGTILIVVLGLPIAFLSLLAGNLFLGIIFLVPSVIYPAYIIIGSIRTSIIRKNRLPTWQKAMATWDTLYYCARNDVVFVPGSPTQCVPSSQMSILLFQIQK